MGSSLALSRQFGRKAPPTPEAKSLAFPGLIEVPRPVGPPGSLRRDGNEILRQMILKKKERSSIIQGLTKHMHSTQIDSLNTFSGLEASPLAPGSSQLKPSAAAGARKFGLRAALSGLKGQNTLAGKKVGSKPLESESMLSPEVWNELRGIEQLVAEIEQKHVQVD